MIHTITAVRQLWRSRRLLAAVGVLAVLAGMAVMYKLPSLQSRSYSVGAAAGQILLDTPDSQVVTLAPPKGSDTLGVRANLIASLMVGGAIESAIAQQAGLHPSQLGGRTDAAVEGSPASGSSSPLSSETLSGPNAYVLTTHTLTDVANNPLPIIQFSAQAPNPAAALRLANATIAGLREYLNTKAAIERIPDAGRLQVIASGVPQVTTQSRGPTVLIAIAAVILVLTLGCAAIVGFPKLARGWRAAADAEQQGELAVVPTPAMGISLSDRKHAQSDEAEASPAVPGRNGTEKKRVAALDFRRSAATVDSRKKLHSDATAEPLPRVAGGASDPNQ